MSRTISNSTLDAILTAQLAIAWAGEGGGTSRLGWWRTELTSEFGGEDLFKRLTPSTWPWVVLQGAREAARRCDARGRTRDHNPDRLISLFSLGFELDERLDERLQDLKRAGRPPQEALPTLGDLLPAEEEDWDRETFAAWVASHTTVNNEISPAGIRLKNAPPSSPELLVTHLVGALAGLPENYPLPHYRISA